MSLSLGSISLWNMVKYTCTCSNFCSHVFRLFVQYCSKANGVTTFLPPTIPLAVRMISLETSCWSAGIFNPGVLAFLGVLANFALSSAISSGFIAFLLPAYLLLLGPPFCGVENMSIRFYTTEDDFVVRSCAPWVRDPDSSASSGSFAASVVERARSEPGTSSKKRKRVRFVDDSGIVGERVGFPPLGDRSVPWGRRGFTPRYMVSLWGERYKEDGLAESKRQKDFWYGLGYGWGWDSLWNLDVDREDRFYPSLAC